MMSTKHTADTTVEGTLIIDSDAKHSFLDVIGLGERAPGESLADWMYRKTGRLHVSFDFKDGGTQELHAVNIEDFDDTLGHLRTTEARLAILLEALREIAVDGFEDNSDAVKLLQNARRVAREALERVGE